MKNRNKIIVIFCSILMCMSVACGKKTDTDVSESQPVAVAVILGRHANANEFSEECYERVSETVEGAVYGGYVSVIISDGTPKKLELTDEKGNLVSFAADANNDMVKERRIQQRLKYVMDFLKNDANRAEKPENNLLGAIKEARASLNSKDASGVSEKYILILDSGIATSGDFKFQDLNLEDETAAVSIEEMIEELKKNEGILPDLSGIKIKFIGLGDVAFPQVMSDTNKIQVKNIWKSLFEACGAEIGNEDILVSGMGDSTGINTGTIPNESQKDGNSGGQFPSVTAIRFIPIDLKFGNSNDGGEVFASDDGIPTDSLGFKPNQAEFIDMDAALYILKPYADKIRIFFEQNPDENIYLIGSVAVTVEGDSGDFGLSEKRAEKVKNILVENYNLPKERLITMGLGGTAPWRVNEFVDGEFVEDLAKNNRAVWILKEDSEKYNQILQM